MEFRCFSNKIKEQEDIFYFKNTIYRVLHEKSNIAASLTEHKKFTEKWILHEKFGYTGGKSK